MPMQWTEYRPVLQAILLDGQKKNRILIGNYLGIHFDKFRSPGHTPSFIYIYIKKAEGAGESWLVLVVVIVVKIHLVILNIFVILFF